MIDLSLKELIIIHINYRDVFNAPIRKYDLIKWITEKPDLDNIQKIEFKLKELKNEGLIIEKNGFLAVAGKEEIIDLQEEKSRLTQELILKGAKSLNLIGKLPFIKFIGISGSVAADNPTLDQNGHVDLDLFIICSKNSLWVFYLVERVIVNLKKLFKINYFYCFNYATEETFLRIHNKSFYTATELVNMITVLDKGVYNQFLNQNLWYRSFYSTASIQFSKVLNRNFFWANNLLAPINYAFFVLFHLIRSLKRTNIKYIFECTTTFDPNKKWNFARKSNPKGGYQEAIRLRFKDLLHENFSPYYSDELVEKAFPNDCSFEFSQDDEDSRIFKEFFTKYMINSDEKDTL